MPFRNYLMEFVVPTLNEGLLEVSNIIPNDPVDLLAEYLYQKSYDVWGLKLIARNLRKNKINGLKFIFLHFNFNELKSN